MFVSTAEPFKLVFSLFKHQYLGFLVESYVVQLNAKGEVTYRTQNISSKNIKEFASGIEEDDIEIVKYVDNIQQEIIFKKFNTKKTKLDDFFIKTFDEEKGDKLVREAINGYINNNKKEIFERIRSKNFYIMGSDGVVTWKEVEIVQTSAKAYFHFERQEEQTVYYPIIKCGSEKVKFQFQQAEIINEQPAALLVNQKLYLFDQYADGKKLKPFLNKPNIIISKKIEETYYRKFIVPLIANFNVFAKGFDIVHENENAKPILTLSENSTKQLDFFGQSNAAENNENVMLSLSFRYGNTEYKYDSFSAPAYVSLEKKEDLWVFHKVKKDLAKEKEIFLLLKNLLPNFKYGSLSLDRNFALDWLQSKAEILEENDISIVQNTENKTTYFLGYAHIDLKIEEKKDWFDVNAVVKFGDFEVPFHKLRKNILARIKEFVLPNGQIAIIPEAWFTTYSELFYNLEIDEDNNFQLKKHHYTLVNTLGQEGLAVTVLDRKLQKLKDFDEIEEVALPKGFVGSLRPYQKAGYDWLHFLKDYKFGGCLADDMGLGKTVTTLAFLQKIKEDTAGFPSLIVMPTSLIYNWKKEAQKFTPKLNILIHFGGNRSKNADLFEKYDLVICSYGVLRLDIDFLRNFAFNYIVLDESQAIKNPTSMIFQSAIQLRSTNRLILTGTPLENNTMDLWSQMTFINPGLLGTNSYFKTHYQTLIERNKDEDTLKKLFARIKPFMLRRHKSQVAKDLPEKIETIAYSQMGLEQEKMYEETKSFVRNQLLNNEGGKGKSSILILQGLSKLRQIANNPRMIDPKFEGGSGKDIDVMHKLLSVVEEGNKVLVFSQYVKHLDLIKEKLEASNIDYLYLVGSTKNRQDLVDRFQNDPEPKVFLISLKAGGVGLNLTAAEYVFILDPWWNPAIEAQAIDRAHRIGQKNTVFSYKFITKDSIEEKILDLQNAKKKLFDDLITTEETFMKSLSEKDILSLFE